MTKRGYKKKFIITIIVLSVGGYLFLSTYMPFLMSSGIEPILYLIFSYGLPLLISSAVIALIWEFFST